MKDVEAFLGRNGKVNHDSTDHRGSGVLASGLRGPFAPEDEAFFSGSSRATPVDKLWHGLSDADLTRTNPSQS